MSSIDYGKKIYVAGHRGMVGSAIARALEKKGARNLVTRTSKELDLRDQHAVQHFFEREEPAYVFLAAAKVGGIHANNAYRGEFLYDNLMIEANVIEASRRAGVEKLLFLGSSCIYPKLAPQPMQENALLTGPLEHSNEPYAIAKIAGIKLCDAYRDQYGCNYISAMPTNLYGPGDNYHLENSHVLPALVRKIVSAKAEGRTTVEIWGTGSPLREFMHADDVAGACLHLMEVHDAGGHVNIGTGEEISILELAGLIAELFDYEGELRTNPTQPDGTPRKLMDSSKLRELGYVPQIRLADGIEGLKAELQQLDWYPKAEVGV